MKAKLVWIAIAVAAAYFVLQNDSFQRWSEPAAYWARQAKTREELVKADRQGLVLTATELSRRRALLPYDLRDNVTLSAGDTALARVLQEATISEFRADIDSLVDAIHSWQTRVAADDSALAVARNHLPISDRVRRALEGYPTPSGSPEAPGP